MTDYTPMTDEQWTELRRIAATSATLHGTSAREKADEWVRARLAAARIEADDEAVSARVAEATREERERLAHENAQVTRLAQHLASEHIESRCEVTMPNSPHPAPRCRGRATAIRFESGFADSVCGHHAQRARDRGSLVVTPKRHDGTI